VDLLHVDEELLRAWHARGVAEVCREAPRFVLPGT